MSKRLFDTESEKRKVLGVEVSGTRVKDHTDVSDRTVPKGGVVFDNRRIPPTFGPINSPQRQDFEGYSSPQSAILARILDYYRDQPPRKLSPPYGPIYK